MNRQNGAATVYRFYDAEWRMIYVGISANAPIRFEQHRTVKTWWREVAFIRCDHFLTRNEALRAETDWIRQERPRYNLAGFEQFILDRQRHGHRQPDPEPIDAVAGARPEPVPRPGPVPRPPSPARVKREDAERRLDALLAEAPLEGGPFAEIVTTMAPYMSRSSVARKLQERAWKIAPGRWRARPAGLEDDR